MNSDLVLKQLAQKLIKSNDRYECHYKLKSHFEEICQDKKLICDAIQNCISKPGFFENSDNLILPLLISGDIIISINLFVPIRDGAEEISQDNIHHHGWRLLTTGVISGGGYETINFVKNSHKNKKDDHVCLKVEEIYKHKNGKSRFIDSEMAHVVFHPKETCATLALWSAEKPLYNQSIKRKLSNFPKLRNIAVKSIHKLRLNNLFGLNPLEGLYFHPQGGKIIETLNYNKPYDGSVEEVISCYFKFFQQIGFDKDYYFNNVKDNFDKATQKLYEKLIAGEIIEDKGLWGNLRRRFTKNQILMTIDNNQQKQ